MSEFKFDDYIGQLRPLTWRDMEVVAQVERELLADLSRAKAREERGHHNADAEAET
jgi:hypothetical protein